MLKEEISEKQIANLLEKIIDETEIALIETRPNIIVKKPDNPVIPFNNYYDSKNYSILEPYGNKFFFGLYQKKRVLFSLGNDEMIDNVFLTINSSLTNKEQEKIKEIVNNYLSGAGFKKEECYSGNLYKW